MPTSPKGDERRRAYRTHAAGNETCRRGAAPKEPTGRRRGRAAAPAFNFGLILIIAVLVVIVVLVCVFLSQCSTNSPETTDAETETTTLAEEPQAETTDFAASALLLDAVSSSDAIQAFSLSDLSAPELDDASLSAIEAAVTAADAQGNVGFVFYDVDSGRGLALDADAEVYGASSFKALYSLYVCESLVEAGELSLDDYCPVSYVLDSGSYYGNSGDWSYPVGELITAAIVDSDNNAFGFLRDSYDSLGFSDWALALGADDAASTADGSWFPTYCARSSAALWTEMYTYLNAGSNTAAWLGNLLEQTETSFIRDSLSESDAQEVTVMDKAGWYPTDDPDYSSLCDAGIIQADGHTYILSVMTSMSDSESNRALFEDIVQALFAARGTLNLQS